MNTEKEKGEDEKGRREGSKKRDRMNRHDASNERPWGKRGTGRVDRLGGGIQLIVGKLLTSDWNAP